MVASPGLNPLHILGVAEVLLVLGVTQPTLLADLFTDLATDGSRAILLALPIAVIGNKQCFAVQALATTGPGLHGVEAAGHRPSIQTGQDRAAEEAYGETIPTPGAQCGHLHHLSRLSAPRSQLAGRSDRPLAPTPDDDKPRSEVTAAQPLEAARKRPARRAPKPPCCSLPLIIRPSPSGAFLVQMARQARCRRTSETGPSTVPFLGRTRPLCQRPPQPPGGAPFSPQIQGA